MQGNQLVDPLNNLACLAQCCSNPRHFYFLVADQKNEGLSGQPSYVLLAVLLAVYLLSMACLKLAVMSVIHGAMYGLFPICWIINLVARFLFNITVKSGQFEVIKNFMASITPDRRLQALLIAFSFGAFLEGAAGFGAPVAISAAMLVGLGFNPLYAAGICLIANTAPVAFGLRRYAHHYRFQGVPIFPNWPFPRWWAGTVAVGGCALLPGGFDVRVQAFP